MRTLFILSYVAAAFFYAILGVGLITSARAEMTCADYDRPNIYSDCRNDNLMYQTQCCAGLVAWKVACDLFHVHAESHVAASNLAYSTPAGKRLGAKYMKECLQ